MAAFFLLIQSGGRLTTIANSSILSNAAFQEGGGLRNAGGLVEVYNSTFSRNDADYGYEVSSRDSNDTSTSLASTFVQSYGGVPAFGDTSGSTGTSIVSLGHTVAVYENSVIIDGVNDDQSGTSDWWLNPQNDQFGDNGGPTATQSFLPGSPVINQGSNILGLAEDQTGDARTQRGATDLGAFETLLAIPDIALSNFGVSETNIILGDTVDFSWELENLGPGQAPAFSTGIYISTDPTVTFQNQFVGVIDTRDLGMPGAHQFQANSFPINGFLDVGTYYVAALADVLFEIGELTETNNVSAAFELTISGVGPVSLDNDTDALGWYATLQDAVDDAARGGTIAVDPNTYQADPESVVLSQEAMRIDLPQGISPTFDIGEQFSVVLSGLGASRVIRSATENYIVAGDGDDTLAGLEGTDTLVGRDGPTTADYSQSDARVEVDLLGGVAQGGHASGDELLDIPNLIGSAFGDRFVGGGEANVVSGEAGADNINGRSGDDILRGGAGDDSIQGNAGADRLFGDVGDDTLFGGTGGDCMEGGEGNDLLNGGVQDGVRNVFVFLMGHDEDRINQLDQAGTDRLELDRSLWDATDPGLTAQQAVDLFGTLNGIGTILTLDFEGGDILEVQSSAGIDQSTFGADVLLV